MAHAEICPVCKGTGRKLDQGVCHGCGGSGWVTVGTEYPQPTPSWCTCHLKGKTTADTPCPAHG